MSAQALLRMTKACRFPETRIRPTWFGATAAIVASGPSLRKSDVEYLRGKCRVIVINDNYRLAPWADALYACDRAWWEYHKPEFSGLKFTQHKLASPGESKRDKECAAKLGVTAIAGINNPGLSRDPSVIHHGGNSGYQAINLAFHLGVKRILLLGFDMQHTGGKRHWFGDHPRPLNNAAGIEGWRKAFTRLADDLRGEGVEVVNCSRETALTCFPRKKLCSIT